jgi:hypothetical protein
MKLKRVPTIIFVIICTALFAASAFGQTTQSGSATGRQSQPAGEALSKKRLLKLLTLNDSTQQELIQITGQKGVDFQPTPADERELHDAGATDDLIVAVRANYRGGAMQGSPQVVQQANTSADANAKAVQSESQPNNANAPAPAPKKKSGLAKFNEKLNKINSALAQQVGSTQTPTAPPAPQTVMPAGPTNTAPQPDLQTTTAPTTPQTNNTSAPAQPVQKKGFLDKLNQGLNKANEKLSRVAATVNPVATQTTTQPAPTNPQTSATAGRANPTDATPVPAIVPASQTSVGEAQVGSAPPDLAGTYWGLLSITAKGETEKQTGTPPDVQFCHDGSWAMLHNGGALQGGKYQVQGGQLMMRYQNGTLFGDFKIQRNGNELKLDDGKYVLRLKYLGVVRC